MKVAWHGIEFVFATVKTHSRVYMSAIFLVQVSYVFQFGEWKNDRRSAGSTAPIDKTKCDETNELYEQTFCMSLFCWAFLFFRCAKLFRRIYVPAFIF